MRILYILVSSPADNYYEQFLLSLTSLKLAMPNAEVVLLCDTKTKESLTGNRAEYEKLITQTITVDAPQNFSQTEVSRWVKTSMRRLVSGDFLFIDCDTIITEDLSAIEKKGIPFGACLDKHLHLDRHDKKDRIIERDKKLGFTSYTSGRHINSGVIWCADTPDTHKVFDRWHELWLFSNSKGIIMDQTAFNMAIYENPNLFTEIDGTWNCQILFNGIPYLPNAKIIHYFASSMFLYESPFTLGSDAIFKKIKETGIINVDILALLKNPKSAFESETRIIAGQEMLDTLNSHAFDILLWSRKNKPGVYRLLNKFASGCIKLFKRTLSKRTIPNKGNGL